MKTGILLCNLGGPTQLNEVKPFLFNLFSDPDILVGMPAPVRLGLAFLISQLKGKSSVEAYRKIGGGSPQLKWSLIQAEALQKKILKDRSLEVSIKVGMRAWKPSIPDSLVQLRNEKVDRLIVLPLFPHFSTTTTGSCNKEIKRVLKKMNWNLPVTWIERWPTQKDYIGLLLETLAEKLGTAGPKPGTHILLSAHSLPMKIIDRGDPYVQDVDQTVRALAPHFKLPYSLAFQSRNGPVPWLKPYVEDEIPRLAKAGVQHLIVLPISFVSDHIETLFELDQEYAKLALECGIQTYHRTRSFNDDPKFIDGLFDLIKDSLG